MTLEDYESRRKFEETPEPKAGPGHKGERLSFVIHKHAARALHYDLRLELEGVLKSWAVPKGPSLDPSVKRLAVKVEDHPIDYKDFEGLIPEHNYGAGSVIIWDRGFCRHPSDPDGRQSEHLLLEGLKKGDMKFVLEGEKVHGEFALVKTRQDEKSWLLLKKKDRYATAAEILDRNRSVVSDKTLEDISQENPKESSRQKKVSQIRLREAMEVKGLTNAPVTPMPHRVKPMLAVLVKEPFDHPGWIFEVKWDGYRAIAEIEDGKVSLYSRNLISFNQRFSPVAQSLGKLDFDAVLDGEIVVLDDSGYPNFQILQDYGKSGKGHLVYYVFDLLYFEGHDLTGLPLLKRRELLKKVLPPVPNIRLSDHVSGEGTLFFKVAKEKRLEGIMAKQAYSKYLVGRRSRQWLKVKIQLTQEGVIGGFTESKGNRNDFGALVLGAYQGDELIFIGHVGGGFSVQLREEIRKKLDSLTQETCPFAAIPKTNTPVTWVKPELVCEVAYHEWTDDGVMRQPVFLRLREGKVPSEIIIEKPETGAGGDG